MKARWALLGGVTGLGAGLLLRESHRRRRKPGIDLRLRMTIRAKRDEVYEFWTSHENFQRVMKHVRDVRITRDGCCRWIIVGPGGAPIRWDARLTALLPGKRLAWKTDRSSPVQHKGAVRFIDHVDGSTTVDLAMTYYPMASATGPFPVERDIKTRVAAEWIRMKTAIESGIIPCDRRKAFRGSAARSRPTQPRKSA